MADRGREIFHVKQFEITNRLYNAMGPPCNWQVMDAAADPDLGFEGLKPKTFVTRGQLINILTKRRPKKKKEKG